MTVDNENLSHWAENDAALLKVKGYSGGKNVARELQRGMRTVGAIAAILLEAEKNDSRTSKEREVAEWVLDNKYLINREGLEAVRDIRSIKNLPSVKRMPAVYRLAQALVRSGDGEVTKQRIELFLDGTQKYRSLMECELWAFVPMLRAALIEYTVTAMVEYAKAKTIDAAKTASILANTISSLRKLSVTDMTETLKAQSYMERMLLEDPAGIYEQMDEQSCSQYRQALSRLARKNRLSEVEVSQKVLYRCKTASEEREKHVGYAILSHPLGKRPSKAPQSLYILSIIILTALLTSAIAVLSGYWVTALLAVFPSADIAKNICDMLALRLTKPRYTVRMKWENGIPDDKATLCVISALITDAKSGTELVKSLETYYHANRDAGKNLYFGILGDLPDSSIKQKGGDKRVIDTVTQGIFELNQRYDGRFYMFLRPREFNIRDKVYMGAERKRGALMELMRLLRGKPTSLYVANGDKQKLGDVKYLITLDTDTRLLPGTAAEMAGAMAHPLNQPVIDKKRNVVVEGCGVILPRIAVDLEDAGKSLFSRVFAGQGGLDPYGGQCSEVYHDLFGEATFTGKGIINVEVCLQVLDGRFPQNRILSHDLLEGSYLRAALAGDVELSDGCPYKVASWYDRLHRWTRGDWQIASWMMPYVPTNKGHERNPLSRLSRVKIFDNLRRSVTPFALLMSITLAVTVGGAGLYAAGLLAVICLMTNLIISSAYNAFRAGAHRVRHHSTIISGVRAVALQTLLQLVFLPYGAIINLHAALASLYRMTISKKHLLRWMTAAQADKYSRSSIATARKMFSSIAWGTLTACFAAVGVSLTAVGIFAAAVGWAVGIAWVAAPWIAAAISKPDGIQKAKALSGSDRAFLYRMSALMFGYFLDFCTPEDNYLPPDNWQEQPSVGIAHRTSPTNIGFGLLCCWSAVDLQLISEDKALQLIGNMLSTIEKLPKWHGHIVNWIDTRTLAPLQPCCVSTVDSGNLAGYLLALEQALLESKHPSAGEIAARAGALWRDMDFSVLYDSQRRLFSICYDMDKNELLESYYDLLASEARQTSFLAVASGQVSRKHWQRLGRALASDDGYRGMASWTGTMFEYFMPHLVLPIPKNSLLYESLSFAFSRQCKRGEDYGIPWGISESCFYAFDPALNYQYKAHGIPALAFKRGLGKETVISPYSSFLGLIINPRRSVQNLRRLVSMGLEGKYGLIEAADFTPARLSTKTAEFEPVRCYMSHHIGMSMVAATNALKDDVWQKRFMRNPTMNAFHSLLEERAPVGTDTLRQKESDVPEKPMRIVSDGIIRKFDELDNANPQAHVLGNASYTVFCSDTGITASRCGSMEMTSSDRFTTGMRFYFENEDGLNGLFSCLYVPENQCSAVFDGGKAVWQRNSENFSSELMLTVPSNENAEKRTIKLKNTSKTTLSGSIVCYFEPVLQDNADYTAHPAFSKLFLEATGCENGIVFHRRPRGGKGEGYAAVLSDNKMSACCIKEQPKKTISDGERSIPLDPCALLRFEVSLKPDEEFTASIALAYAMTSEDVLRSAKRTLSAKAPSHGRIDGAIKLLKMSTTEVEYALDVLRQLLYTKPNVPEEYRAGLVEGQRGLWKSGISGDLPIILSDAHENDDHAKLKSHLKCHRFLRMCGIKVDLVILSRDGADYMRPVRSATMEVLKQLSVEKSLASRGGVHIVDIGSHESSSEEILIRAVAHVTLGTALSQKTNVVPNTSLKVSEDVATSTFENGKSAFKVTVPQRGEVNYSWDNDGSFSFKGLPPRSWGHVLANRAFGCLVNECGLGHSWRYNSRENKMTKWINDSYTETTSEALTLKAEGLECSLFTASDGFECTSTYGFGFAKWEKRCGDVTITTTAFVPKSRMARVLIIDVVGAKDATVTLEAELVMGVNPDHGRFSKLVRHENGVITAENPYNKGYSPQMFTVSASENTELLEREAGQLNVQLKLTENKPLVLVTGCAENHGGLELISKLRSLEDAEKALEETQKYWQDLVMYSEKPRLVDEAVDKYFNGWSMYQVIACRLFARASMHQCGGAYGFRDQLQDSCAALVSDSKLTRTQIFRACVHQYEEGDVQHWWHPENVTLEGEKGVRTRCSDDLLWLPYPVCDYLEKTSDNAILEQELPFITSTVLLESEDERYETPRRTEYRSSVFDHCVRAIDCALTRGVGDHGLPFIGNGDWNDGLNKVGKEGKGESVWLAWFLAHVLERFGKVCLDNHDFAKEKHYKEWRARLIHAAASSWDGGWFRRGYYDDGSTLGSQNDEECKIDSIAQSFSVFFADEIDALNLPGMPKNACKTALDNAWAQLVDEENGIIKLFTPAFNKSSRDPGYIKGYVSGVRENGGQYTHAAVWLAMAYFKIGDSERGKKLMHLLAPSTHPIDVYKQEPYVLAADIYSCDEHVGRGGWSYYTGAASWYYRIAGKYLALDSSERTLYK